MLEAVLFDLDGTLLLHDFNAFQPRYFGRLARAFATHTGTDVSKSLLAAVAPMLAGGPESNVERFTAALCAHSGLSREQVLAVAGPFYANEFPQLGAELHGDPAAADVVAACRRARVKTVLATNPVFPRVAILERLRWCGLGEADFDLVTYGEDFTTCKPHAAYYRGIVERIGVPAAACLMVGNDSVLDLAPAAALGMRTWLVDNPYQVPHEDVVPGNIGPLRGVMEQLPRPF